MVNKLNYNGVGFSSPLHPFYPSCTCSLTPLQRKSGGTKLGQTIHKDILKSVNAALKSPKSLKSRSPKDPRLEIYAEGKELGDDGLEIICNACVQVLAPGTAKLDELNLAKNQITIDGLRCLTPVIRFALNDIRDLDLRGNHIAVCSPEAEKIWEEFLSALSGVSRIFLVESLCTH